MERIAFYDMDKTVTRKATFMPFAYHVLRHHKPLRFVVIPLMIGAAAFYGFRFISRTRLKEINLALLLGRKISSPELEKISSSFAQTMVAGNVLGGALRRIESDRADGYHIVMATASCRFYAADIAERVGIADVVATDNHTNSVGQILHLIDGENCYGEAKLRMVSDWLAQKGIARDTVNIRFYSDHVTDAPCLAWADEAFATNAHGPLSKLAQNKGWAQLNWLS